MEGRVDDSGSRIKNGRPGSLVVSSQCADRWKRGTTGRGRGCVGGGGVLAGFRHRTDTHTNQKTNVTHSQQRLGVCGGVTILFVAMATQDSLCFPLSLTWTDVSKHILVKYVQPSPRIAPLQLCDASFRSDQHVDNNGFAHVIKQMHTSPQAHRSPGVRNCAFGLENDFMWIARDRTPHSICSYRQYGKRGNVYMSVCDESCWANWPYDRMSSFMCRVIKQSTGAIRTVCHYH